MKSKKKKYCNCEECWTLFIKELEAKDPEMLPFALKFKDNWIGRKFKK